MNTCNFIIDSSKDSKLWFFWQYNGLWPKHHWTRDLFSETTRDEHFEKSNSNDRQIKQNFTTGQRKPYTPLVVTGILWQRASTRLAFATISYLLNMTIWHEMGRAIYISVQIHLWRWKISIKVWFSSSVAFHKPVNCTHRSPQWMASKSTVVRYHMHYRKTYRWWKSLLSFS